MKKEHLVEITLPSFLIERKGDGYISQMIETVIEGERGANGFNHIDFVDYKILEGSDADEHPQFKECITFELKFIVE
ncbi:MAG: hypothetical protein LBF27_25930 [Sphingobacterium sp.]|jgi:hypothetical protein|nr:hypothetical protein [Sphingobacterium sp.]